MKSHLSFIFKVFFWLLFIFFVSTPSQAQKDRTGVTLEKFKSIHTSITNSIIDNIDSKSPITQDQIKAINIDLDNYFNTLPNIVDTKSENPNKRPRMEVLKIVARNLTPEQKKHHPIINVL